MRRHLLGIAEGGEERLREATEARIRAKYQREFTATTTSQQKAAIDEKVRQELRDEMKRIASPYSLWARLL